MELGPELGMNTPLDCLSRNQLELSIKTCLSNPFGLLGGQFNVAAFAFGVANCCGHCGEAVVVGGCGGSADAVEANFAMGGQSWRAPFR